MVAQDCVLTLEEETEREACPADFEQSALPSCGLKAAVVLRGRQCEV